MTPSPRSASPSTPRFDMTGKVAVVAGGTSGIGRAVAELFMACGASVAILSRGRRDGDAVAKTLDPERARAKWFECDVTDEASVARAFSLVAEAVGPPTILINSAGLLERGAVEDTTRATWDDVLSVNATGTFLTSREVVPYLRAAGGGVIVNVSSEAGMVGIRGLAAYSAAKAAVISLTRCMALDLAEEGIRVNCVCPGTTRTPMVEGAAARLPDPEAELARYASVRPMQRLGEPAEIASAVALMASDECGFATGSVLAVDGGYTA